jgi:hypothetical protein
MEHLADVLDLSNGSDQHGDANAPDCDEVAARDRGGKFAFTPCQLPMEVTAGIHLAH